jgi:hypothetical protein
VNAGRGVGGACSAPRLDVPTLASFEPPPAGQLDAFQVTLRNRCAETVWPAWESATGLDYTRIDTQVWLPLAPGSDHTVMAYSTARLFGFWGRTGCSFDAGGGGACQTGDCSGFRCGAGYGFPWDATVFQLQWGFVGGYNVGMSVEGATCGTHECVADLATCSPASTTLDACGTPIACSDICDSAPECCSSKDSGCSEVHATGDTRTFGDLVITFCP